MKATKNKRVELSKTHIDRWFTTILEENIFTILFSQFFFLLQSSYFFSTPPTHGVTANDVHASSLLQFPTPRGRTDSWISTRAGWSYFTRFCPLQCMQAKKTERWMKFILTWFACFKEKRSQVTLLDSCRKIVVRAEFFPSLFMTG